MSTITRIRNIFKRRPYKRKFGYYWVAWGIDRPGWRVGAYIPDIGWKLPGDERLYQDIDFFEINERKIPQNHVFGFDNPAYADALKGAIYALILLWLFDIYTLIKELLK